MHENIHDLRGNLINKIKELATDGYVCGRAGFDARHYEQKELLLFHVEQYLFVHAKYIKKKNKKARQPTGFESQTKAKT